MKGKNKLENSRFLYTTRREETLYFADGRKPETYSWVEKDIHYGKIPDNCKADICNLASRHTGYLPHFFYTIKNKSGDDTIYCRGKEIGLLRDTDKLTVKFFYEETPDIYSIKEMEEMLPKAEFLQYLKDRMDEVCA